MAALILRIGLLAGGLAFAEIGLDSLTHDAPLALADLVIALALLVAGTAGFVAPLLRGGDRREAHDG